MPLANDRSGLVIDGFLWDVNGSGKNGPRPGRPGCRQGLIGMGAGGHLARALACLPWSAIRWR